MRRTRLPALAAAYPIILMGAVQVTARPVSDQDGEQTFKKFCVACHTIGGGRLVGPDLAGVTSRRSEEWLIAFVQHSQDVIASGDPEAVALSQEYPGLVMPDWPLSDDEVRAVLAYVDAAPSSGGTPAPPPIPESFSPQEAELGLHLFQGTTRLTNGGPACNGCHEVTHDAVIGGGVLAKDLTTVFSRLGGAGVRAIVGAPPFPVMERAFRDRPLTDDEQRAILAFLQRADSEQSFQQPRDYGLRLVQAGLAGAALLLGLYTLLWSGRRKGPVNQKIFSRQVRST